jgi:predicted dithiol-disulfide oxidoreductase (DUF899 family)
MVQLTFPGESGECRQARNRLLQSEVELRRQTEAVAAGRGNLPPGGAVAQDYPFEGLDPVGEPTVVRLSDDTRKSTTTDDQAERDRYEGEGTR